MDGGRGQRAGTVKDMKTRWFIPIILFQLTLSATATARTTRPDPAYSMQRPEGWGAVALVVVRLSYSEEKAPGEYCPSPDDPNDPNEICLGAAMFYQRGYFRRTLAVSDTFIRNSRKYKTIVGHAARAASGGSFLAVLENTDDGYYWVPWRQKIEHGHACINEETASFFHMTFPASVTKNDDGDYCLAIK
jgi:hypothetical protein